MHEVVADPKSCHGQAWFQLELIKTNMGPETVITKRLIIDHMAANNLKQHKIEITKPMLKDLVSLVLHKRFTETFNWTREAGTSYFWRHQEIETSSKAERQDCQNDEWWVCWVCQCGGRKDKFRDQAAVS